MRYIFHFVLAWCLLCGFLAGAQAAITGKALLGLCQTALHFEGLPEDRPPTETEIEDLTKKTLCWGYLYGVSDTVATFQGMIKSKYICLPEGGAKINQTIGIVVKYLEAHPEELKYRADSEVQMALKDAFPCPESEQ